MCTQKYFVEISLNSYRYMYLSIHGYRKFLEGGGHHWLAGKTPFKWHFAGGPMKFFFSNHNNYVSTEK